MMKNRYHHLVLLLLFLIPLAGCGGSGVGGGEAVFTTVTLTASPAVSSLDSSVVTHSLAITDPNFCVIGEDFLTVTADSVNVTITSTLIPNLPTGVTASQVSLQQVTLQYTPADTISPALPDQYLALDSFVTAGGSATVPIIVASQALKMSPTLSALVCTTKIYHYYVTMFFEGVEVNTNVTQNFETTMDVYFADFTAS
jgi:hypothetical protein